MVSCVLLFYMYYFNVDHIYLNKFLFSGCLLTLTLQRPYCNIYL